MNSPSDQGVSGTPPELDPIASSFGVLDLKSELMARFVSRLKEAMAGRTVADLARSTSLSHSTVRAYVEGVSLPTWENAVRIAHALGKRTDWFASSERDVGYAAAEDLSAAISATSAYGRYLREQDSRQLLEFAMLPLYDVRASAGHGAWNDEERISKTLAFRRDWLRAELSSRIADLILVYAAGDSMEPTISSGDVVMVDRGQLDVRDGIYVWQADGALLIKRLQRLGAGQVRVLSDNPRFPAYEADLAEIAGPAIVGRAVWAGVKL